MAARKVTFTLDSGTVELIEDAAERLKQPKSRVVRDAVADYHSRIGRLSETERRRMLKIFDTLTAAIPTRPVAAVEREIADIRQARRSGGRLSISRSRR